MQKILRFGLAGVGILFAAFAYKQLTIRLGPADLRDIRRDAGLPCEKEPSHAG